MTLRMHECSVRSESLVPKAELITLIFRNEQIFEDGSHTR